jgi:hypothetical protein
MANQLASFTRIHKWLLSGLFFFFSAGTTVADGLWQPDGVTICAAAGDQTAVQLCSDNAGGAIFTWQDKRSGNSDIYCQRVTGNGNLLWVAGGVQLSNAPNEQVVPRLISDMAGGAIILCQDYVTASNYDIYGQRVDANGNTLWASGGLAISIDPNIQYDPRLINDMAGGVLVTWADNRSGNYDIYGQRVNASGNALWTANGKAICLAAGQQAYQQIISDASGGALVFWQDDRNVNYDIYAQRVDANGNTLWAADGKPICLATGDQYAPRPVSDGAGGAILVWPDTRNGNYDIYAQRVDGNGNTLWAAEGVVICNAALDQISPQLISDGAGGALVVWQDYRNGNYDIYGQRIDGSGNVLWAANGAMICNAINHQTTPQLADDGAGGAITVWQDQRSGTLDIYSQRINGNGNALWPANGLKICSATGVQDTPQLIRNAPGSAIMAWRDLRAGNADVYAQKIIRPWPVITGVSPDRAVRGKVAGPIAFSGYVQDDQGQTTFLALTRPGYQNITATALTIVSTSVIQGNLDLTQAEPGIWNVVAYDTLGQASSAPRRPSPCILQQRKAWPGFPRLREPATPAPKAILPVKLTAP